MEASDGIEIRLDSCEVVEEELGPLQKLRAARGQNGGERRQVENLPAANGQPHADLVKEQLQIFGENPKPVAADAKTEAVLLLDDPQQLIKCAHGPCRSALQHELPYNECKHETEEQPREHPHQQHQ